MDFSEAFYHIELERAEDRQLCSFITQDGVYSPLALPMGIKVAPQIMQYLMDTILREHQEYARGFVDDVIVFSQTFEEHVGHLEKVFRAIKAHKMNVKASKTKLAQPEVKYCGFRVSKEGISKDAKIVSAVQNFPDLNDPKLPIAKRVGQVQSFLGLAGFYRRFIPKFAEIERPLREVAKKDTDWVWTEVHTAAVQELKEKLTTAPVLAHHKRG